jgi:hypothetical protein
MECKATGYSGASGDVYRCRSDTLHQNEELVPGLRYELPFTVICRNRRFIDKERPYSFCFAAVASRARETGASLLESDAVPDDPQELESFISKALTLGRLRRGLLWISSGTAHIALLLVKRVTTEIYWQLARQFRENT